MRLHLCSVHKQRVQVTRYPHYDHINTYQCITDSEQPNLPPCCVQLYTDREYELQGTLQFTANIKLVLVHYRQ